MSMCPACGLPPTATSQDAEDGQPYYECENAHWWKDTDGE